MHLVIGASQQLALSEPYHLLSLQPSKGVHLRLQLPALPAAQIPEVVLGPQPVQCQLPQELLRVLVIQYRVHHLPQERVAPLLLQPVLGPFFRQLVAEPLVGPPMVHVQGPQDQGRQGPQLDLS